MEKEKRIEEMAKIMFEKAFENYETSGSAEIDTEVRRHCYFAFLAYSEAIYNAGYRKQEDILHEWVERETAYLNEIAELKKKIASEIADYIAQTRKRTAREIYDFAKDFFTWDEEGFVRELKECVQDYGVED